MIDFLLLIAIGLFSACMSSVSGAGTALFSMPLLLIAGIPVTSILAANQVSSSIWTPIASRCYAGNVAIRWPLVFGIGGFGILGVFAGTVIIEFIPISVFKKIIGVAILLVVTFIATKKDFYEQKNSYNKQKPLSLLWGFPLGLYQSLFGAASMFSSLMFCKIYSCDLRQSLAYAYAVAFPWCVCAATIFYFKGWVVWSLVIPFAIGSTFGAYFGSKIGSRLSTKNLRKIVLFIGMMLGIRFILFA
jgi:uncharacterized membrane protein YfcA